MQKKIWSGVSFIAAFFLASYPSGYRHAPTLIFISSKINIVVFSLLIVCMKNDTCSIRDNTQSN